MLAGYLPFDDDPANPEGDNINLLYKYIVSTPLTFPEYVTPHARDLLRRILVPDPRRRADLFEVARHSWLSEYSHVVGFIGSSNKSDRDIATSAMQQGEESVLGRSASVREPASRSPGTMSAGGARKQPPSSADAEADSRNKQRDAKRRTVQLEYVAPKDATARGEASPTAAPAPSVPTSGGRTIARADGSGPVEVAPSSKKEPNFVRKDVPTNSQAMPPPVRPARDQIRATSDSPGFNNRATASTSRPNTSGTLGSARLPSRGNSYSQPAVPTPSNTNAQGYVSQPKSSSGYIISGPMSQSDQTPDGSLPNSQQNLAQYQQQQEQPQRGHKRSSTLGSIGDRILGRSGSRRASQQQEPPAATSEKRDRKYPPVSMRNAIPNNNEENQPRTSTESSRRPSFGFSRKNSDAPTTTENKRSSRRFSFLPAGFSMNNLTGKKEQSHEFTASSAGRESYQRPESKGVAFGRGASRSPSRSTTNSTIPMYYEPDREAARNQRRSNAIPQQQSRDPRYEKALPPQPSQTGTYATPPPINRKQYRDDGYGGNLLDPTSRQQQQDPVERYYTPTENLEPTTSATYVPGMTGRTTQQQPGPAGGYSSNDNYSGNATAGYSNSDAYGQTDALEPPRQQQMRPSQRKFVNEYDHGHSGSSGATRRVMDFFRRRGKDRSEA